MQCRFVDTPFGTFHLESAGQGAPVLLDHPETTDQKLAELIVLEKRQLGDDVGATRRPGVSGRELHGT